MAANARRAARDPSAVAYLGERNSAATGVSLPITNAAGLLQVSPSNSDIGLNRAYAHVTEPGTPERYRPSGVLTFGRILPADDREADAMARYLSELGVRRVAILHDFELYGKGLSYLLRERLRAYGIAVAWHGGPSPAPRSVARVVGRLRGVRAGALVSPASRATRRSGCGARSTGRIRAGGCSAAAGPPCPPSRGASPRALRAART